MSGILNLLLAGAASVVKDAYFNLVTLLLNTTSTNGAQNNTFLDSSSSPLTITRNGNVTQGTFTPFSQTGWSNYLASNSALGLTLPSGGFGAGDFTLEYWFYPTSLYNYITVFSTTRGGGGFNVGTDASGLLVWYSSGARQIAAGTISPNQWHHAAFVRSGSTLTGYLNGVSVGTATVTTNFSTTSANIGSLDAGSEFISGYVSNLRAVVGTAVYTSNFTPPTAPLTAVTNTKLLTCQSNRFVDNSASAITLSISNGTPSVQAFSPFAPTAAYSTSVVGGSGYFDGSGDYLSIPYGSGNLGSGNWTVEFFMCSSTTTPSTLFSSVLSQGYTGSLVSGSYNIAQKGNSGQFLSFFYGTTPTEISTNIAVNDLAWHHVALSRNGTTLNIYVDGKLAGTGTLSAGYSFGTGTSNPTLVGYNSRDGGYIQGYFTNYRVITGQALYSGTSTTTANFTVPTGPLTTTGYGTTSQSITGTVALLLNMTNAGIYDSAAKNDLETVGTAQVSTTQAKWGSTSMKFDGSSSSWLFIPFSQNLNLSTGSPDWTLECWAYIVSYSNSPYLFNKGGVAATYYTNYSIVIPSSGVAYLALGNNGGETGYNFGSVSTNTWYHFAATRQGNTIRTFLNGTLVTNTTIGTAMTDNGEGLYIGVLKNLTTNVLNGYIDDLRITKGYARYTASFTPPSSAFPIQ